MRENGDRQGFGEKGVGFCRLGPQPRVGIRVGRRVGEGYPPPFSYYVAGRYPIHFAFEMDVHEHEIGFDGLETKKGLFRAGNAGDDPMAEMFKHFRCRERNDPFIFHDHDIHANERSTGLGVGAS